jgi:hypothetical protein
MTVGVLGRADLAAATITNLYTVPANTQAMFSVRVVNRNATAVLIRIGLSVTAGVQSANEYIEYDYSLAGNQVLEETGLVMQTAGVLTVRSDTANVTAIAYGFEEVV